MFHTGILNVRPLAISLGKLRDATLYKISTIICHVTVACAVILGVKLVEQFIHLLWHGHDPMIFGQIRLGLMFEIIDFGVIVALGFRSILEAFRAFGGEE